MKPLTSGAAASASDTRTGRMNDAPSHRPAYTARNAGHWPSSGEAPLRLTTASHAVVMSTPALRLLMMPGGARGVEGRGSLRTAFPAQTLLPARRARMHGSGPRGGRRRAPYAAKAPSPYSASLALSTWWLGAGVGGRSFRRGLGRTRASCAARSVRRERGAQRVAHLAAVKEPLDTGDEPLLLRLLLLLLLLLRLLRLLLLGLLLLGQQRQRRCATAGAGAGAARARHGLRPLRRAIVAAAGRRRARGRARGLPQG